MLNIDNKMSQLIIPGILSIVIIGVTIYFHRKCNEMYEKTEDILDILTQQQNILSTHDSVLQEVVNKTKEHIPDVKPLTPEMNGEPIPAFLKTPNFFETPKTPSQSPIVVESPSPELLNTPCEEKKILSSNFDKELMEELQLLQKEEEKHKLYKIEEEDLKE